MGVTVGVTVRVAVVTGCSCKYYILYRLLPYIEYSILVNISKPV